MLQCVQVMGANPAHPSHGGKFMNLVGISLMLWQAACGLAPYTIISSRWRYSPTATKHSQGRNTVTCWNIYSDTLSGCGCRFVYVEDILSQAFYTTKYILKSVMRTRVKIIWKFLTWHHFTQGKKNLKCNKSHEESISRCILMIILFKISQYNTYWFFLFIFFFYLIRSNLNGFNCPIDSNYICKPSYLFIFIYVIWTFSQRLFTSL